MLRRTSAYAALISVVSHFTGASQYDTLADHRAPYNLCGGYLRWTYFDLRNGAEPSELKMPNSWQDYQLLQEKCAALTVVEALSAADRAEAAKHEQNLANFYGTFKDILAGGWAMLNNVEVEDAVRFIELKEGKKSVGAGTGSGDDEEFARTVQE